MFLEERGSGRCQGSCVLSGTLPPNRQGGDWGRGLTCPTIVKLQRTLHAEGLSTAATAVAVLTIHLLKGVQSARKTA